ncbi:hypothetical protein D3C75_544050 [compost metagenome]
MLVFDEIRAVLINLIFDEAHRLQNGLFALIRSQPAETFLGRQLNVDAHTVGEQAEPGEQHVVCAGNGFYMDVTSEIIDVAQQLKGGNQLLGGIIGTPHDAGAEEQALYVITAVELHRKVGNLPGCERSPPCRI